MVSIILPTYNEAENIKDCINGLFYFIHQPLEVIVVDDDSSDYTWRLAEGLKKEGLKVIRRIQERGLATAIERGLSESRGDIVGWMDADMSMPPEALAKMLDNLGDYDVVIGSRYVKGGKDARGIFRVMSSRLINFFAGLLLGFKVRDYDSGFIALRRKVLDKVQFPAVGYGDYFIEFIYKCNRAGLKIKEVPYVFRDRFKGESKTQDTLWGFFRRGFGYIKRIISLRFCA